MKKIFEIASSILFASAFIYLIIHFFIIKSDGIITTDLWGFVIPEPPMWTTYFPGGGFLGSIVILFSLHGIVGSVIFLFLGGAGYSLHNLSERNVKKEMIIKNQKQPDEKIKYAKNGNPIILGEELDEKNFPNLYKWAKTNPNTLVEQIESVADQWHEGSHTSAIIALEMDLSHQ
jgi:hypothetical protein